MGKQYLNGVLYGSSEVLRSTPYIYSTEEREVGVWLDGKPIYQKTVRIDSLPDSSHLYQYIAYPHNIADIDTIVNYEARSYWKSDGQMQMNERSALFADPTVGTLDNVKSALASNVGSSWSILVSKTAVRISVGTDRTVIGADVTIWYTKTTDEVGSGRYTTRGGEARHYSETEQVIGTWTDGSTLYEKSGHIAYSSLSKSGYQKTANLVGGLGLSGVTVREYDGCVVTAFGRCPLANSVLYIGDQDKSHLEISFYYGGLCFRAFDYQNNLITDPDGSAGIPRYTPEVYVTLRYTKNS